MGIKIQGLDGLQKKLQKTVNNLEKGSDRGKERAIELLANEIRDDAPVDTGNLRDSVRAEEDGVHIGADYASEVEDAQPFIQPAVNRLDSQLVKKVAEGIREELT